MSEEVEPLPFELSDDEKVLKIAEKCTYKDIDEGFLSLRTCKIYLSNQRMVIFKTSEDFSGFEIPLNSIEEISPIDSIGSHKIELTYTPKWGSTKNIEVTFLEPASLNPFKKHHEPIRDEWLSLIQGLQKQNPPIDREKFNEGLQMLANGDMSVITPIPIENVPVILKKNEICYAVIADGVEYWEERAVRNTSGGYSGFNVPITKGISVHTGGFGAESRSHDEMRKLDIGNLIVTNKRVIFDGNTKNVVIPLNKILSVTAFSDGIGIDREDRKKTELFLGGYNGLALKSVIHGLIRNLD